jgi:hypothetical protein
MPPPLIIKSYEGECIYTYYNGLAINELGF